MATVKKYHDTDYVLQVDIGFIKKYGKSIRFKSYVGVCAVKIEDLDRHEHGTLIYIPGVTPELKL